MESKRRTERQVRGGKGVSNCERQGIESRMSVEEIYNDLHRGTAAAGEQ